MARNNIQKTNRENTPLFSTKLLLTVDLFEFVVDHVHGGDRLYFDVCDGIAGCGHLGAFQQSLESIESIENLSDAGLVLVFLAVVREVDEHFEAGGSLLLLLLWLLLRILWIVVVVIVFDHNNLSQTDRPGAVVHVGVRLFLCRVGLDELEVAPVEGIVPWLPELQHSGGRVPSHGGPVPRAPADLFQPDPRRVGRVGPQHDRQKGPLRHVAGVLSVLVVVVTVAAVSVVGGRRPALDVVVVVSVVMVVVVVVFEVVITVVVVVVVEVVDLVSVAIFKGQLDDNLDGSLSVGINNFFHRRVLDGCLERRDGRVLLEIGGHLSQLLVLDGQWIIAAVVVATIVLIVGVCCIVRGSSSGLAVVAVPVQVAPHHVVNVEGMEFQPVELEQAEGFGLPEPQERVGSQRRLGPGQDHQRGDNQQQNELQTDPREEEVDHALPPGHGFVSGSKVGGLWDTAAVVVVFGKDGGAHPGG
mmetsp:Transcript_20593/g.43033  ORF Transcript_20593/g.43033 Transcript_20593/m.43033 type:complete len:471 (+) Transcript_20593:206-1618(+)